MRQGLKYGAGLIGIYLAVVYFDGATSDLGAGGTAISNVVAAFQGRAAGSSTKVS